MKIVTKVVLFCLFQIIVFVFIFLFAVIQQRKIIHEVEQIWQRDMEMSRDLSDLTVYQLEYSVQIERYIKQALEQNLAAADDEWTLQPSTQLQDKQRTVASLLGKVDRKINKGLDSTAGIEAQSQYLRLRSEFDKVEKYYQQYIEISQLILGRLEQKQLGDLAVYELSFTAGEDQLNLSIEMMLEDIQQYTSRSVKSIRDRERKILGIYQTAGGILLLSVIVFLVILTRNIHLSISNAVTFAERIEAGDRDISVKSADGDEVSRIVRAMRYMLDSIIKAEEELKQLAMTDALTGAANRLKFNTVLAEEVKRAERYSTPLSIIFLDIDHFKTFNDTYGHDEGDRILVEIAMLAAEHIRSSDLFARWGGEEFAVLTPGTGLDSSAVLAEKLRVKIEQHIFTGGIKVTSSFGVASLQQRGADEMLKGADDALYNSKNRGRNRVSIWQSGKAEEFL